MEQMFDKEGASYRTALKMGEIYKKYGLSASVLGKWLAKLRGFGGAEALKALFHQAGTIPQAVVPRFVDIVLSLISLKPAGTAEICIPSNLY